MGAGTLALRVSFVYTHHLYYYRSIQHMIVQLDCGLCSLVLPAARSCAVWNDNNKDDVCTRTIPAGLKCPPPSKTVSLITRLEAYLNTVHYLITQIYMNMYIYYIYTYIYIIIGKCDAVLKSFKLYLVNRRFK